MDLQRSRMEREHGHSLLGMASFSVASVAFLAWMMANPTQNTVLLKGLGAVGSGLLATKYEREEKRLRQELSIVSQGELKVTELSVLDGLKRTLEAVTTVTKPLPAPPLPVEDLARAIASYELHILMACSTGSGKTTTINRALQLIDPSSQVHLFDPKNSKFGGLEKTPNYCRVTKDNATDMIDRLQKIYEELEWRQENRDQRFDPLYVIFDEFNSLLGFVKKDLRETFLDLIKALINMGREDKVRVWIVGQSHLAQNIGIDRNLQKNFALIAQGRNGDFESIEGILNDAIAIPNQDTRKELNAQLKWHINQNPGSGVPVAYCGIGGKKLMQVADYEPYRGLDAACVNNYSIGSDTTDYSVELEALFEEVSELPELVGEKAENTDEHKKTSELVKTHTPNNDPFGGMSYSEVLELHELLGSDQDKLDRSIYDTIQSGLCQGWTRTNVIKKWMKFQGEKYSEGAAEYDRLMEKYGNEN